MDTTVPSTAAVLVVDLAPAPPVPAPWAETVCGERTGTGDDHSTCRAVLSGHDGPSARRSAHDHLRSAHGMGMDRALAAADVKVELARRASLPAAADFPAYDFMVTPEALADQGRRTATALVGALVNGSMSAEDFDARSAECAGSPQRHFALAYAEQVRALLALLAR